MKASIAVLVAGAAVAAAQLQNLSPCGQKCIQDLINYANSQGCSNGDAKCYCNKVNFGYGIRDCATQAPCPDAQQILSYGTAYCANVNGGGNGGNGGSASGSAGGSATGSMAGSMTGGDMTMTSGGMMMASSTPVTTTPLVAVYTSNGSAITTTTGMSTVYGAAPGATDSAGNSVSSAAASVSSALASGSSALASASSAAGSATSRSSGAGAPMKTAGPMLGGAAIAAVLLL